MKHVRGEKIVYKVNGVIKRRQSRTWNDYAGGSIYYEYKYFKITYLDNF